MNKCKFFKQYFFVTIGVLFIVLGFYFFLEPAGIVTGGATGLSIIVAPFINKFFSWFTSSIFIYIFDTIVLILGLIILGKDFFFKTIYASILVPTLLFLCERFFDPNFFLSTIEDNGIVKFTALLCGALLTGLGIGVALKNNGSTGGMDVVQKILSKFLKIPFSKTMYLTDWVIVFVTGFIIIGTGFTYKFQIANVIFGIIGVIIEGYIADVICLSTTSKRTVYVITSNPDRIKQLIYEKLDRGVTLSKVTGGYTGEEYTMVICTMDKNEAYRITSEITEIDKQAFTFVTSCKEVRGEYEKRGIL